MGSRKGVKRGKYKKQLLRFEEFHCSECNVGFKRKTALKHHIYTVHRDYIVLCPICEGNFSSISSCKRHLRKLHSIENTSSFNLKLQAPQEELTISSEPDGDLLVTSSSTYIGFPYMGNFLSFGESKYYGRYIEARFDINAKEILFVAPAFAAINCVSSTCCFQCGKSPNSKFIQCNHCIDVWFCSQLCSANRTHRAQCHSLFDSTDCHIVRTIYEIVRNTLESVPDIEHFLNFCNDLLCSEKEFRNYEPPYSTYGEVLFHASSKECDDKHYDIAQRATKRIMQLEKLRSSNRPNLQRLIYHLAYQHATVIEVNLFSIESPICHGICTRYIVYDAPSRLNHSCTPNAEHRIDNNDFFHLAAIKHIKKGEQIFIDYLGSKEFKTAHERKDYLKDVWDFCCNCEKCAQL
ncbi:uncharacterized protein LOC116340000 [Contarinia nasturtii]|uniref:uncharacterized protein LOC116340000 n=1 Tax=Contarinia nasturtii TaxID=265458 RepID=UPI0012D3CF4A|nr:uncharacterized protein LOC116340000 [Contarinia nasturtii]